MSEAVREVMRLVNIPDGTSHEWKLVESRLEHLVQLAVDDVESMIMDKRFDEVFGGEE